MPRPIDLIRDEIFPEIAENLKNGKCAICGDEVTEFRDELSKKEFSQSGMCQNCQDKIFGV